MEGKGDLPDIRNIYPEERGIKDAANNHATMCHFTGFSAFSVKPWQLRSTAYIYLYSIERLYCSHTAQLYPANPL